MTRYQYKSSSLFAVNQLMFSALQQKPQSQPRSVLFKSTIDSTRRNSQFANFHFVKISQKQFGEYKGSTEYHQRRDIFDAEPLTQQSGRETDNAAADPSALQIESEQFGTASNSRDLYSQLEAFERNETHQQKQNEIDLYKSDKLDKFQ